MGEQQQKQPRAQLQKAILNQSKNATGRVLLLRQAKNVKPSYAPDVMQDRAGLGSCDVEALLSTDELHYQAPELQSGPLAC